jgi:hypothetical protein
MSNIGWAFGAIQASAYAGESTQEVWQRLNDAAEAQGLPGVPLSVPDVSILRGFAGQVANAAGNLAAADPELGITSDMVGNMPWSMSLNTLQAAPEYWARVQMTVADEAGNLSDGWMTMTGITSINMTAGQLNQLIQQNAEAAAISEGSGNTPRGALVSTGRVELIVAPGAQ